MFWSEKEPKLTGKKGVDFVLHRSLDKTLVYLNMIKGH